jgi:probable rRNA maturation factor
MKKPKILVTLKTYQRKWPIERGSTRSYLLRIWKALAKRKVDLPALTEMTVVFLNDSQMRVYNRMYRRKDATTDVLSFPVNDNLDDQGHYLGDVLISMEQAGKQAVERSRAMEEEIRILMLHGVLHLLGYDHETDRGQMNRLEKKLRLDLGLADGHK